MLRLVQARPAAAAPLFSRQFHFRTIKHLQKPSPCTHLSFLSSLHATPITRFSSSPIPPSPAPASPQRPNIPPRPVSGVKPLTEFSSPHAPKYDHETIENENTTQSSGVGKKFVLIFSLAGIIVGVGSLYVAVMDEDEKTVTLAICKSMPLRVLSRMWGELHHMELPTPLRVPLYQLWTWIFNCHLDEMRDPIESYENLNSFFIRHLKQGIRPMSNVDMICPVDGKVSVFGEVTPDGVLEQVKGSQYRVNEFLGFTPKPKPGNSLYYIVLYLAPGDYHRYHSSSDVLFTRRQHFAGELFPVLPDIVKNVPGLFVRNERIVLSGEWKYGFYAYVPVGAYNVGSMRLKYDDVIVTNAEKQVPFDNDTPEPYGSGNGGYVRYYNGTEKDSVAVKSTHSPLSPPPDSTAVQRLPFASKKGLLLAKGEEIGRFELGSTVVLIFETKANGFQFTVQEGQKIKLGQPLGNVL